MFTNLMIMHLHIAPNRLISDIQKEFNKMFPFLKIEFFNNKSFARTDFSAKQIIANTRKVGDTQLTLKDGRIEIEEEMKVNELEKRFKEQFNLAVQVFRKSGNLWLETTMTDNWTLVQQNNHGREISTNKSSNDKKDKADDFDLTRDSG
jgi:glycerol-3-phosphate O-acyltransferase